MIRTKITCKRCNTERDLTEFHMRKSSSGKIYPFAYCKQCKSDYDRSRPKRPRDPLKEHANSRRYLEKQKQERKEGINIATHVYRDTKGSDRKKGRMNDLDISFVEEMLSKPCSYCGEDSIRLTLDRIDNSIGHTKDNVVTACCRCNHARGDMPYEAWLCIADGMRRARLAGLFGQWRAKPFSHTN